MVETKKLRHEKELSIVKKQGKTYKKLFAAVTTILTLNVLTGCSSVNKAPNTDSVNSSSNIEIKQYENIKEAECIDVIPVEWTKDTILGADMALMDYATNDTLIFHGSFGLFVYDLNNQEIKRSVDLRRIKCNSTQGDSYCEVDVSKDGKIIEMHPADSDNMYVYNVDDNVLYLTEYCRMVDSFQNHLVDTPYNLESPIASISYKAVKLDSGEYGYLYCAGNTLETLQYICGDMVYLLFI